MNLLRKLDFLLASTLLLACGNMENEYSSSHCYFVFDNSVHQDAVLASSCNAASPGIFCIATKRTGAGGATYFDFTSSSGTTSSQLANAVDLRRTSILGYNGGLIIGFGNLSYPYTLYVYDRECPNCFDPDAIPVRSKPLSISGSGMAKCGVCGRKYDMNNGGIVSDGDAGNKLTRYRGSTTGPYGVLTVN